MPPTRQTGSGPAGPSTPWTTPCRRSNAVAVKDGRILAVGTTDEVMKLKGDGTVLNDLAGHAMVPGFVDAHSHVYGVGVQALSANLLAPPDGNVENIAGVVQRQGLGSSQSRRNREGQDHHRLRLRRGDARRAPSADRSRPRQGVDRVAGLHRPPVGSHRRRELKMLALAGMTAASKNLRRVACRTHSGHRRAEWRPPGGRAFPGTVRPPVETRREGRRGGIQGRRRPRDELRLHHRRRGAGDRVPSRR